MTPTAKILSTRLTAAELEEVEELGRRLGTNTTDTIKLALRELKKSTGLLKFDTVALYERIARQHGDDCKVKFKILDLENLPIPIAVTVNGEEVPDIEAHVLFATASWTSNGEDFKLPSAGHITAKDLQTDSYYSIGQIRLERGAIIEIPLSKLLDLVQDDSDLTPEERRDHIRKNAQIRRAYREFRGEDLEDE